MSTPTSTSPDAPSATPAHPDDVRLMHHEYDGIQEYDNPLPFWWSGIFILCTVHAAWYLYWYQFGGPGKTIHQEYAAELKTWQDLRARAPVEEVTVDEETLVGLAQDPGSLERGRAVFVKNCVSCHMDDGRGQIGPNLTDLYQIHGKTRLDLYTTIHDGVPDKGMLTWNGVLPPEEMMAVAAYVSTLRGKQIPGKPSEGAPVEPFR